MGVDEPNLSSTDWIAKENVFVILAGVALALSFGFHCCPYRKKPLERVRKSNHAPITSETEDRRCS